MNIKITYKWLLDFLDTNANPYDIQKYLSLAGPSIERVEKINNDYVYDIEVISNRIDYASVFGIAQETSAILPIYNKKANLKINPFEKYHFNKLMIKNNKYQLKPTINENLCSRFSALIFYNIKIKPSPDFIKNRLILAGVKSINNVVDISNYLMLTLGQPVHMFDYDKIFGQTMILRESKKGEKIITLDGNQVILPGGDIVIEDGHGRLIDLCGIMGGLNSAIDNNTKRVILFVQTYNKEKIRKTTMTTGIRTLAATYFEKGLDEERVEPTLVYGAELIMAYANGQPASKIIDIYKNPYKEKTIELSYEKINQIIGITIDKKKIINILSNLGFKVKSTDKKIVVSVPSYRKYDVSIPEDLIEEIARIYGYNNLKGQLQPLVYIKQPEEFEKFFNLSFKIKYFLKHLGLNEVINYSMISEELIKKWGNQLNFSTNDHIKLANPISKEIEYMRLSLIPSLYKNLAENTGKKEILKFFEIAKVYYKNNPKEKTSFPANEIYRLAIAVNTDYLDLKGIIEALFKELNLKKLPQYQIINKDNFYFVEIDFQTLIQNYQTFPKYQSINPYAVIKLDKTFEISEKQTYNDIENKAKKSNLLKKIEVISLYKNKLTLRFYFSSNDKNLTEEEAIKELEKI